MVWDFCLGLVIILLGAEAFTNGVEWLGSKLRLSEGAVGSILAAVGTALPESMIPLVAILWGRAGGEAIGIGAILGAPFMLGTLAFFLAGFTAKFCPGRAQPRQFLQVDISLVRRDLVFFILVYTVAVMASFTGGSYRYFIAAGLVLVYFYYAWITVRSGVKLNGEKIERLYFWPFSPPPLLLILLQLGIALIVIILGAEFFVEAVMEFAESMSLSPLMISLLLVPIATELPEKFNSIIWLKRGKDTLALGNITGAMVFQSSIIPAIGIVLTPWKLDFIAMVSVILVLASSSLILLSMSRGRLRASSLMMGGFFYLLFFAGILWGLS